MNTWVVFVSFAIAIIPFCLIAKIGLIASTMIYVFFVLGLLLGFMSNE